MKNFLFSNNRMTDIVIFSIYQFEFYKLSNPRYHPKYI